MIEDVLGDPVMVGGKSAEKTYYSMASGVTESIGYYYPPPPHVGQSR